ncbi:MAG: hypothetical protein HY562_04200 [Ignavibacteriales bacterium]|nr:hypothetical protein [Ignavibacteriales bacterium]
MKTFSPDMGDWFGIKYGASTSGGPIEDRTMFLTFYETRSGRHFSALAHFVLWRDHDGRSRVTRPSIGGGFKLRFPFKRIGFFVEAGTNVWVGLGVGILPYIDLGSEVFLNERLSFSLSAKRFAYARNKYFFLAGASYQISKMIR